MSLYSASLFSSSSPPAVFLAGFFFFLFLFPLDPVDLVKGCSRIFKISSSTIFFSVLNLVKSGVGGAASLVKPFLVMAVFNS